MKITLVGMGSGTPSSLTVQGLNALREAELIIGARRLLESLPDGCTGNRAPLYKIEEICALLRTTEAAHVAVAYSGDTGFYSGASALCRALEAAGLPYMVCPGLSSVQLLAAALGRPWQDWKLVSAHGCACTPALVCSADTPTFFLTGGSETPATLCEKLTQSSGGNVQATVGENLGTAAQRLVRGTAQELARQEFAALSVLLVEPCPALQRRVPGLPDEVFIRGKTPMTKQEVRAAVLAKLAVRPGDILWDVGAGTGSVSVEMALAAPAGQVYAAECDADACELIRRNRAKFHAENLHLTAGKAPEVLVNWPAPDAVFIGGSKGNLAAIIDAALAANPAVRLCISAIALETLQQAIAALAAHGLSAQVTQIAVSRSKEAGSLHLLMANNPVFLIVRE
ncbi:precorrin-6y C5,15-methyltransferase (decarboxylating) subunit CbiE [Gemmiger sp.]|uniref:precorrin-6y C5,15-methyltransferase (decarboxylating) subunit CbiE n=1 Tax=Gemmiger sp. TaxID=2049027 RepID=UPI003AF42008